MKQKVFVGLSGGVDSSVAALRLKQQGYEVVGVFIKVWQPDFLKCDWETERLDAMRVAAHLEIPFLTCNAEEAYKNEVGEYFISEYKSGRTPNPDVMCNQHVKFGAFLDFATQHGADFVATGHYAQKIKTESGFELLRGNDSNKDQSYFLWTLTQDQLSKVLLPVGDSPKDQIRKEAKAAKLPTAVKKDSQGVCFLGHIDIPEFLSHFVDLVPGKIIDESGNTIGAHKGALAYTLGQRHGFDTNEKSKGRTPHYVVAKDLAQNTLTVSKNPPQIHNGEEIVLTETNWIPNTPVEGLYEAQIRYRQKPFKVKLSLESDAVVLEPEETVDKPAVGQSCVLYEGKKCLGGGIIS